MKTSRDELKAIVKQCLLEILQEGIGTIPQSKIFPIEAKQRSQQQIVPRRSPLDERASVPDQQGRRQSLALAAAIKAEAGGNPIMESIFADTASRTLPAMLAHGDSMRPMGGGAPGGAASMSQTEQFSGDPEQVFGEEAASKWAALAFMDSSHKK